MYELFSGVGGILKVVFSTLNFHSARSVKSKSKALFRDIENHKLVNSKLPEITTFYSGCHLSKGRIFLNDFYVVSEI